MSCTAVKDGASETYQTTRVLQPRDTIVAFNQLTEKQVLGWCFTPQVTELKDEKGVVVETITKDLKADVEAFVSAKVELQLAQSAVSPALPWAKVAQPE